MLSVSPSRTVGPCPADITTVRTGTRAYNKITIKTPSIVAGVYSGMRVEPLVELHATRHANIDNIYIIIII